MLNMNTTRAVDEPELEFKNHGLEIQNVTLYNLYLTINKRMFIPRLTDLE
jgi:hypothetical protein